MIRQRRLFRSSTVLAFLFAAAALVGAQTHPLAPQLASNPGATYTLYLDFSGFNYPGNWGGGTPGNVPAYDTDGNPTAFSTAETVNIRNTWAAVAQKYVGFNINVTTVDPASSAANDAARKSYYDVQAHVMHTIIGGSNAWFDSGAGGVSYVGTTQSSAPNSEYHTNWVFPVNEANGDPKDVSEAAGHENGHGLGLQHQTDPGSPDGYSTNGGASGNGSYAPTMGVGYYSQRSTWRNGTSANNGAVQNDVKTILSQDSMGSLRDDAIGHSLLTATSLAVAANGTIDVTASASKGFIVPASSTAPTPLGVANYTTDYFKFHSNGGSVSLTEHDGTSFLQAGVADLDPTLQGTLRIYSSSGLLVGSTVDDASTLLRTFTGVLGAGDYYAQIGSIGGIQSSYDAQSQYYTMGGYFLTGSGFAQAVPEPSAMVAVGMAMLVVLRRRRRSA